MGQLADILIRNAVVVTVNPDFEIIENGAVAIKDGRIDSVGSDGAGNPAGARHVIDACGGIVMPGLVNTHTHLPMSLFRGLADDLALDKWLTSHIFPAEAAHVHPDTVQAATLLSCAEMLLSGTTACCDGYFYENFVAEAVAKAGIRALLGQGVIDFPAPDCPDPEKNIDTAHAFVDQWKSKNARIIPSIFCHSPYTCSAKTLQRAKQAADKAGVIFQIHVAETRNESENAGIGQNRSVAAYLADLGVLGPNTLASHCVWLSSEDIVIFQETGTKVSHNPESNMKLASGIAPVPAMLAAGICAGLGTDGCASNNNLDMFETMGFAAKLHKAAAMDPTVMDAETVVRMATIQGAESLGLGQLIGSVEPGKAADLIVIDTRQTHLCPLYHPESHLVYAVRGADVSHVLVDGQLLVERGRLVHMDVTAVMAEVSRIGQKVVKTDKHQQ